MPPPNKRTKEEGIKIWSECSVTLNVTEFQFIKFSFGQERILYKDDQVSIEKAEKKLYESCEEIVNKRVRKLQKLIRAAQA